jgi:hypothetical protein
LAEISLSLSSHHSQSAIILSPLTTYLCPSESAVTLSHGKGRQLGRWQSAKANLALVLPLAAFHSALDVGESEIGAVLGIAALAERYVAALSTMLKPLLL